MLITRRYPSTRQAVKLFRHESAFPAAAVAQPGIMVDEKVLHEISVALPFMQGAPQEFINDLRNHALKLAFPKGQQILHEDDRCQYLPIVLSGDLRVYRTHSSGREVTLYHIGRGESCFLTMNCIFLNQLFPASARAEEYSEALMVPAAAMQRWQDKYPFWQKYIFEVAASRLVSVISVLSDIAFARMDERVAQYLAQRWRETGQTEFQVTHQEIANELGTAREVVTRVLRSLEEQGILSLTRGAITVADLAGLTGQKTRVGGD